MIRHHLTMGGSFKMAQLSGDCHLITTVFSFLSWIIVCIERSGSATVRHTSARNRPRLGPLSHSMHGHTLLQYYKTRQDSPLTCYQCFCWYVIKCPQPTHWGLIAQEPNPKTCCLHSINNQQSPSVRLYHPIIHTLLRRSSNCFLRTLERNLHFY